MSACQVPGSSSLPAMVAHSPNQNSALQPCETKFKRVGRMDNVWTVIYSRQCRSQGNHHCQARWGTWSDAARKQLRQGRKSLGPSDGISVQTPMIYLQEAKRLTKQPYACYPCKPLHQSLRLRSIIHEPH